jgi:hypothetical protein
VIIRVTHFQVRVLLSFCESLFEFRVLFHSAGTMSLHALKEPIMRVSRCGVSSSSPKKIVGASPRRHQSTSKVLAALEALELGCSKGDSIDTPVTSINNAKINANEIQSKPWVIPPLLVTATRLRP